MADTSKYDHVQKSAARRRGAAVGKPRQLAAPNETYAARRRRFFAEADAMLRSINAALDEAERTLTEARQN